MGFGVTFRAPVGFVAAVVAPVDVLLVELKLPSVTYRFAKAARPLE